MSRDKPPRRFPWRGAVWLAISAAIWIPLAVADRRNALTLGTVGTVALLSTLLTIIAVGIVMPSARFVFRLARGDAETHKRLREGLSQAAETVLGWAGLALVIAALGWAVNFYFDAKSVIRGDDPVASLIDGHRYFAIYLLGCVAASVLLTIKAVVFWALAWITKSNILATNLKKLEPESPPRSFGSRAFRAAGGFVLEALFSWINVAIIAWQIVRECFRILREAVESVPENIRELRFPLRSNPELPAESVWAYLCALSVRAGAPVDETDLIVELDRLSESLPAFDRATALSQLERLNVLSPATLAALKETYIDSEPSVA